MLLLLACVSPSKTDLPAADDTGVAAGTPTWHQDIAPVITERCGGCHTAGGVTPFPLDTYADAAPMALAMAAAVESGAMPPWGAISTDTCEPRFGWQDDPRLSDAEKAALRAWADAGAPEGDPAAAAELPEPPAMELVGVNQTLSPSSPYVTSGDDDEFICFTMDPGRTAPSILTGIQVVPGDRTVVHHVLVFTDPAGESEALAGADGTYPCFGDAGVSDAQLLDVWVPGAVPFEVPEDSGMYVSAGSRIVMQIHYHPNGAAVEDQTSLQLRWGSTYPTSLTLLTLLGNAWSEGTGLWPDPDDRGFPEFRIPANSPSHTEQMSVTLDGLPSLQLFMVGTHMHYVGVDMQIDLTHANPVGDEPETECLLQTPRWDFDWQRFYAYDAPIGAGVEVRDGDVLKLRCEYDNTVDNPGVRRALADGGLDEPQDVYLGEETLDEMCLGMFGVVYPL